MIISTTCNSELLYIDKQYLNILKNKEHLNFSFFGFSNGSVCDISTLTNTLKVSSAISMFLHIRDMGPTTIIFKPINFKRDNYHYDSLKYVVNTFDVLNNSVNLIELDKIETFERLLDFERSYNVASESYVIRVKYLKRRT